MERREMSLNESQEVTPHMVQTSWRDKPSAILHMLRKSLRLQEAMDQAAAKELWLPMPNAATTREELAVLQNSVQAAIKAGTVQATEILDEKRRCWGHGSTFCYSVGALRGIASTE